MKYIAMAGWAALLAACPVGCALDTETGAPPATSLDDATDLENLPPEPEPLLIVEDDTGSVAWHAPADPDSSLEVVITFKGTAAPILHPDFVDDVGPVPAYMATTEAGAELPEPLRAYATEEDLRLIADDEALERLRGEARAIRDAIQQANDEPGGFSTLASSGCTSAQRTAARNGYGAAYSAGGGSSGSKTCGDSMNFHSTTGTVYYCNFANCEQDYTLALGQCGGVVDNNCTTVGGKTTSLRARFQTSPGAGATFQHYGTRYRFGYYNCSDTYTAVMRRKRGGGDWIYTNIGPGSMQIRVGGGAYPPPYALAHTFGLGGSVWQEDHDWSTSATPMNSMNMVAQTDGFMCGDIIQRFRTYDASSGACNGGKRLCDDGTCTGTGLCFD